VEEHIWGDGYDSPETNERYNWYVEDGVKGTPDIFFNGLAERVQGLCCDCDDIEKHYLYYQSIIEKELAKTSPIDLNDNADKYHSVIFIQDKFNKEILQSLLIK
jgi:hypothetical protein